jgi:hypothetical protein
MHPNPIRDVFNADNPNYFYGIVDLLIIYYLIFVTYYFTKVLQFFLKLKYYLKL